MAKHASPAAHLQVVESPGAVAVQLPLPVLRALTQARGALMDLFVGVGRRVLEALMEQDRETLCGPKGKHDHSEDWNGIGDQKDLATFGYLDTWGIAHFHA